jgi:hypothetical protein
MRPILTCLAIAISGAAAAAQAQRPAETRAVPIDLVCGPTATLDAPSQAIKIVSGQERVKTLFAAGDAVIINAGTSQGLSAGQHFFVRRVVKDSFTVRTSEKAPRSIHTAGWLTIVEARTDTSIARIAEACDGIEAGDYLDPLSVTPAVAAQSAGRPDFSRPAHVILADDRRQLGAGGGSLMVIDRGTDHGVRPGQRLTLFRPAAEANGPVVTLGEAFVASSQPETSLIRIQKSREAIQVGDLVAIHR